MGGGGRRRGGREVGGRRRGGGGEGGWEEGRWGGDGEETYSHELRRRIMQRLHEESFTLLQHRHHREIPGPCRGPVCVPRCASRWRSGAASGIDCTKIGPRSCRCCSPGERFFTRLMSVLTTGQFSLPTHSAMSYHNPPLLPSSGAEMNKTPPNKTTRRQSGQKIFLRDISSAAWRSRRPECCRSPDWQSSCCHSAGTSNRQHAEPCRCRPYRPPDPAASPCAGLFA